MAPSVRFAVVLILKIQMIITIGNAIMVIFLQLWKFNINERNPLKIQFLEGFLPWEEYRSFQCMGDNSLGCFM